MTQETAEAQIPEAVRKQAEEADKFIQGLNTATSPDEGGPEEPSGEEEEPAQEPSQHPEEEGAGGGEQEPASEPNQEPSGEEDYKAKYLTLKGKYDAEVPRLHQERKELQQQIQTLQNQVKELQQQVQQQVQQGPEQPSESGGINPEELKEYGPEFEKLAQEFNRLNEENARLKQKTGEIEQTVGSVQEHQQQSAEQRFWSDLEESVPSWREINEDQAFHQWLQEADPFSGKTRNAALQEAQQELNGHRAAQIFNYFVEQTEAGAKYRKQAAQQEPPEQPKEQGKKRPAQNVQPPRSRGSDPNTAQGNKSYWTKKDINDLYDKQRRGFFEGREEEFNKREQDLFQAMREGRVET